MLEKLKKIGLIAVNSLLLILIALCLYQCSVYSGTLNSQKAADIWKGESEERFAQVTAFFPVGQEAAETDIMGFRYGIDEKLADGGVEAGDGQMLWADGWSSFGEASVTGEKAEAQVSAVGVGGNFFLFHPYKLMSGSYLAEDDLMGDRVVLDHELAWTLFGASDVAGMTVTIGAKPYYVAGVVQREQDKFTEKAYTDDRAMMFMSWGALQELSGEEEIKAGSYELVIADPISGFAKNMMETSFENALVVENSARYDFTSIWSIFSNFGARSIIDKGVSLPYWENAARISEVYIARLWVVMAFLSVVPLITLGFLIVKLIKFINRKLKQGKAKAKDAWEDRYGIMARNRQKRQARKAGKVGRSVKGRNGRDRFPEAPEGLDNGPAEDRQGGEWENPFYDEESVAMDVENIVKEIMEEEGDGGRC